MPALSYLIILFLLTNISPIKYNTGSFKPTRNVEVGCKNLMLDCIKNSKGLLTPKNYCYEGEDKNVKYVCAYETKKDCIDRCKRKAGSEFYIASMDCENLLLPSNIRYVHEGKCILAPKCKHIRKKCKNESKGRVVLVNTCTEAKNEKGHVKLYNECIYVNEQI